MATLRAKCIATPNINTVKYSNFKIFSSFLNIFVVSAHCVTIIGYFIVSSGNGMVFNFTNFTNFFDKTCSFQFSAINCHYSSFPAPGGKKSRLGFANSLQQNFLLNMAQANFFKFLKIVVNF